MMPGLNRPGLKIETLAKCYEKEELHASTESVLPVPIFSGKWNEEFSMKCFNLDN